MTTDVTISGIFSFSFSSGSILWINLYLLLNMIILPAQIESIKSRKDRTTAIVIGTNELTPDQAGQIFSLQNSFVYCALKEEEFATNERDILNDLKADFEIEKKSNGQRLRNVLYKLYEQDKEGFLTFTKYYDHKMEQLINHFKSKLEL